MLLLGLHSHAAYFTELRATRNTGEELHDQVDSAVSLLSILSLLHLEKKKRCSINCCPQDLVTQKLIFPSQPTNLKFLKVNNWKQRLLIARQPETLAISNNMFRSPILESHGFNPSKTNLHQENVVHHHLFVLSIC